MPADTQVNRNYQPSIVTLRHGRVLPLGARTLVMGVINVTPDSFFAPSRTPCAGEAIERALRQVDDGADILDVGGESSRPGADPVGESEEIDRVLPVIEGLRKETPIAISIDTRRAAVARFGLAAGADIVNDVTGLLGDPEMPAAIAQSGAIAIVMHMRGTSQTMQKEAQYDDVVLQVKAELGKRLGAASRSGIRPDRLWIDPGIGFAKTVRHNLDILKRLDEFQVFEKPLVIGTSRKSFIGRILDEPDPQRRLEGSLASATVAVLKGAHVVRVHDVAETLRAVRVADAIRRPEQY